MISRLLVPRIENQILEVDLGALPLLRKAGLST